MKKTNHIKINEFKTLQEYCSKKGYKFWADNKPYNVFIYGIRKIKGKVNLYDDTLGIAYIDDKNNQIVAEFEGTTDPGLYYLKQKLGNKKGTAILCPGQYRHCWELGKHGKYKQEALVQSKKAKFKVWRDNNNDGQLDFKGKIFDDVSGLNLHTTRYTNETVENSFVNSWSAGCQVIKNPTNHSHIMTILNISAKRFGDSFSYTLFEQ